MASQDYNEAQRQEQNELDRLGQKMEDIIDNVTGNNIGPVFSKQGYCSDKLTNYIDISAIAKDSDLDPLTYTLKWGLTDQYEKDEMSSEVLESGQEVTFHIEDLDPYVVYYWRIDASDGKKITQGVEGTTRTYCQTTKCTDAVRNEANCTNCTNGVIKTYGKHTNLVYTGGNSSYSTCAVCKQKKGCSANVIYKCGLCGTNSGDMHVCSGCNSEAHSRAKQALTSKTCYSNVTSTSECKACLGSGKIITYTECSHKKTSHHYYCEHGDDYETEYHDS